MSSSFVNLGDDNGMSSEHQNMLDQLLDVESGLSDREVEFIDSLDKKRQYPLSQKQAAWLEAIYERMC